MAIFARTLRVRDYRSYDFYELDLSCGVNVLVGPNAAGKTNLIEAVQLLTAGQSFRRPTPRELVREGAEAGRIALSLEGEGRVIDLACDLAAGKRRFAVNGKRATAAGVRGILPSVLFCPDHLDMVKRSAGVRRAALDDFGCQLSAAYANLVAGYERTLEQRNSLLRDGVPGPGVLDVWDEALTRTGAALIVHRRTLLARLAGHLREVYASIAPHERADASYVSSLIDDQAALPASRDDLTLLFQDALRTRREEDIRRGTTGVGPHRDEILLTVGTRPARSFGSQGQQRSLVLAWKIAEVKVTHDILERYPILRLDDVMSELDAERRDAIVRFIEGEIQTVITTTNLGYFGEDVLGPAKVVRIGGTA